MPQDPLLLRIQARDLHAFRLLVRRCVDSIYAIAFCILGTEIAADDAVQRVFLELWQQPSHFLDSSEPMLVLLFSRAVALSRAVKVQTTGESAPAFESCEIPFTDKYPTRDSSTPLQRAFALLPADERLILLLCYSEGLSPRDIANIARLEPSLVTSVLAKNRNQLRRLLRVKNAQIP